MTDNQLSIIIMIMKTAQIFHHADFKQPWRVYVETMPAGEELIIMVWHWLLSNRNFMLYIMKIQ
jgi:hypothetical protein